MAVELDQCVASCRKHLIVVAVLSGGSNVLALTGAIFMLTVYDRVIPSGSVPTLLALGIMALFAYSLQGLIDVVRIRILTRIGLVIRESLGPRVFDILVRAKAQKRESTSHAVRDLDQVQAFMSSMGPTALFDLPWLPLYLIICFAMHPYIGFSVLAGAALLIVLTLISNIISKGFSERVTGAVARRDGFVSNSEASAETLHTMGMGASMASIWNDTSTEIADATLVNADTSAAIGTLSRTMRVALQSFVLGVGAYLVINQLATGGIIIAGSILSARALAPIDLAIGNWKNFVAARQSWERLGTLFARYPREQVKFSAPMPTETLRVKGLTMVIPGIPRVIVRDVSFNLEAGQGLGIIGQTGSGKSTLARGLAGLWEPAGGSVRLDDFEIDSWSSNDRGHFIGYLPQEVVLFEGTLAQNISRFTTSEDKALVIDAARMAGVHDLISRMPDGYDTRIASDGSGLSGGQAQRIGLARALYGNPFLLILDEPNSNLDAEGDIALQEALQRHRRRNRCYIVIAHRPSIVELVDHLMVLRDGRVQVYGDRQSVMDHLRNQRTPAAPPAPADRIAKQDTQPEPETT